MKPSCRNMTIYSESEICASQGEGGYASISAVNSSLDSIDLGWRKKREGSMNAKTGVGGQLDCGSVEFGEH